MLVPGMEESHRMQLRSSPQDRPCLPALLKWGLIVGPPVTAMESEGGLVRRLSERGFHAIQVGRNLQTAALTQCR